MSAEASQAASGRLLAIRGAESLIQKVTPGNDAYLRGHSLVLRNTYNSTQPASATCWGTEGGDSYAKGLIFD
jgi:hypothetical protein